MLFPCVVLLDHLNSVGHRGKDMVKEFDERPMLDEGVDVKAHRDVANAAWNQQNNGYLIEAQELEKIYRTSKGGCWECYKRPYQEIGV